MARNVTVTWRPLTQWPAGRERTATFSREEAKFRSAGRAAQDAYGNSRWESGKRISLSQTLEDLDRELWHLGASDVVVQVDLVGGERAIRQDGQIRADARAASPAVVLTFKRRGVPHVIATDHFTRWEDNLRAIAKGLEALRLMERYHITQAGEQYRGWQALPASTTTALSTEQAADVLATRTHVRREDIINDREHARRAYQVAANRAHPDAGGSTSDFQLVQEAKRVLEAHHGGTL